MKKLYKTELHAHTKPVSACSDIEIVDLVRIYKENGYDSVCVTNHFLTDMQGETSEDKVKWYAEGYYNALEEGKRLGINVILGAEVRFTENFNDYLVYGICPEDLIKIYELLPYGIDNFYKEFKNYKNIIIQAHPFRNGMERADVKSLDGIEVFNMHPNHNSRVSLALKHAEENNLLVTCGSDFHHYGQECLCGILTEKPVVDSYELAEVLKKGEYKISIGDYVLEKM